MNVSLREFKARTNQLVNILDQADEVDRQQRFLITKAESATFDLFDMECDMASMADIGNQIKTCKRGFKLIRKNDTND